MKFGLVTTTTVISLTIPSSAGVVSFNSTYPYLLTPSIGILVFFSYLRIWHIDVNLDGRHLIDDYKQSL